MPTFGKNEAFRAEGDEPAGPPVIDLGPDRRYFGASR